MAEIAFEYFLAGIETARGTAQENPTRRILAPGMISPLRERWRPEEARGLLAEYYHSADVRRWSEFEAEGAADVTVLPLLLNAIVEGGVTSPTTPTDGVLTRLWTFEPTLDADTLESMTLYWGDPNVQVFRATYCMIDELSIEADATGGDGVMMTLSGQGQFPSKNTPTSVPSAHLAPLLIPAKTQVWIDTTSAIGTTAVTGRVLSASLTINSGIARKWVASGPDSTLDFATIGRGRRHAELSLRFEVPDTTQYDLFEAGTSLKVRVRFNGPEIESVGVGPTTYYYYIEADVYGPVESIEWGENETNRTLDITIFSEYDSAAGYDFAIRVQNDQASL